MKKSSKQSIMELSVSRLKSPPEMDLSQPTKVHQLLKVYCSSISGDSTPKLVVSTGRQSNNAWPKLESATVCW